MLSLFVVEALLKDLRVASGILFPNEKQYSILKYVLLITWLLEEVAARKPLNHTFSFAIDLTKVGLQLLCSRSFFVTYW